MHPELLAGDRARPGHQMSSHNESSSRPDGSTPYCRCWSGCDRRLHCTFPATGLRVAGTVEFASLDSPPNDDRAEALLAAVPELLPHLRIGHGTRWMGHRPCLPDSLPVIDRSRHFENVFYAFGNGHLGLTAAPMTGEIAAALATRRPPPIDASPFRASRFA